MMLYHICKINFKQNIHLLKKYKTLWVVIAILLLSFQVFMYQELASIFQDIQFGGIQEMLFPLFSNISIIVTAVTFFFLNVFTIKNETYLRRMAINRKHINMAHYYPVLLSMCSFFFIQSFGGIVAFFVYVQLDYWHKFIITFLYLIYLLMILLLTFIMKVLIQIFLKKIRLYYFHLEIIFTLIYIALYMVIFVIGVQGWIYISPAYWITSTVTMNPMYLILIFLTIAVQFFCFNWLLGKIRDLTYKSKNKFKSVTFKDSFIYNGFLFENIQLIRNQNSILNFVFGFFLGISAVILSYFLFGTFNQEGYFDFFILFLGFGCGYVSMYSENVVKTIRALPMKPTRLLVGKAFFYLLLTLVMFHVGLTLFKVIQMNVVLIEGIEWSAKILFITSLAILVNVIIKHYTQDSKLITGFLIFFIYLLIDSIINWNTSIEIYSNQIFIGLTVLFSIGFIMIYQHEMERREIK